MFEGFKDCEIIIQEYIEHSEQVYKLYGIGPNWFGYEIRHSVPHDKILESNDNAFVFDSQVKFNKSDFHYFNTDSRLDKTLSDQFVKIFTEKFQLLLFGIDIIITKDGRHLVIDCNYLSSYSGIDLKVL